MTRTNTSESTHAAFYKICTAADKSDRCYVSLYASTQEYGGPEEGGWYWTRRVLVATQQFADKMTAENAVARIQVYAKNLTKDSERSHNRAMSESCDWLEARGLDADFLPEPDGPETYEVRLETTPGEDENTERPRYE